MENTNHQTIDVLNSLLRNELAAIDAYSVALHDRSAFSAKAELSVCQRSHETRAAILRDKVVSLGGQAATKAGLGGLWSKALEVGAAAVGDDMAIRALEQDEDHVLRDYKREIPKVAPEVRTFLELQILPEEELTHRTVSDLKRRLATS